ncbi:putative B3 domain-containing protein Os03g0621600 isoform X2 [Medicago truncatula]|uniref:putative B3 domain-containing protein Os03g0621600 isoform X2 n=1 Tax=Medicago truncatula TaxID=3880 RepID=UPI001966D9F4|nr:putative B3 domain-containing protein Os03g0621600 isoform X2 [Medicago truncatula]
MEGTQNCVGSTKSLEELIYWTHFQFIHFTLFLSITDFHHQLALPKTFSDNLKKKLPENVTIKCPSGIVWNIGLTARGDTVYFTNSWQQFVKDHSLKENDFLVFKYNGESHFEVLIFNGNSFCEKAASYFVQKCGQAHSPSSGGVEDIYWSYFKFTHFTLLVHTNFERHLALPKTFSDNLNKKLPENVTLKGPSGVTWNIRLTTRDGFVYFVDGWQQFMNDHSLKANDFLVCKYNGESHFEVLIFDGESFCEKEASYFVEKCGHAQTAQGGSNASETNNSIEEVDTDSNGGDSPEQFTDDAVPKTTAIQSPFIPTGKRTKRRRRSPKAAANWGARAHAWVTCNKQHPEYALSIFDGASSKQRYTDFSSKFEGRTLAC